jgi:hypothetical protein
MKPVFPLILSSLIRKNCFQEKVAGKRVENALAKLETTMKRTPVKIPGRALHFAHK